MKLALLLMALLTGGCMAHAREVRPINSSPTADRYGWSTPRIPIGGKTQVAPVT